MRSPVETRDEHNREVKAYKYCLLLCDSRQRAMYGEKHGQETLRINTQYLNTSPSTQYRRDFFGIVTVSCTLHPNENKQSLYHPLKKDKKQALCHESGRSLSHYT